MTYTTELTIDDHKDFLRMLGARPGEKAQFLVSHFVLLVSIPLMAYAAVAFVVVSLQALPNGLLDLLLGSPMLMIMVGVGVLLLPVAVIWLRSSIRLILQAPANAKADSIDKSALREGLNLGETRFEPLVDGLRTVSPLEEDHYLWSAFQEVRETDQCLFLMLDDSCGVIVPKRAFCDAPAVQSFKALIARNIEVPA